MAETLTLADLRAGDQIVWEHTSGFDVRLGRVVRVTATQLIVTLGPGEDRLRFDKSSGLPVGEPWPSERIRPADAAGLRALAEFERREQEAELREDIEDRLPMLSLEELQRVMGLLTEMELAAEAAGTAEGGV